ncbi:LexA family transcriptional regulator [Sporomusa sp.]|uniref:LexA family transcriptional regulator n=1 Tax=Sporomusa sp. TaxID=2078658 RepID=UPI002BF91E48|nr:S24 family peptidase [Sporomusa sp.]HWR43388.1 S24 family peptidase [Sporomusa sp.]
MTSFTERLIYLIKESGASHTTIFEKTGISTGNLSSYRSGRVKPSFDAIVALSDFFNVSTDWLLKGTGPVPEHFPQKRIPVYSCVDSDARFLNESQTKYLTETLDCNTIDFSGCVKSDRMQYVGIYAGDMAFFKRTEIPQPGQIVAVRNLTGGNELTLQFFIKKNSQAYFRSANPDYEDVLMTSDHQIDGVLVGLLKVQFPSLCDYESFLTYKQQSEEAWAEIIALAFSNGIPAQFVKQLIEMQIAMLRIITESRCKE